jgi:FMN phosphatase YigB (HAD superfamily)
VNGLLVSLDVGGTLAVTQAPGPLTLLAAASPLRPAQALGLLRARLHTCPVVTDAVVAQVCADLEIPRGAFVGTSQPPSLRLLPGVDEALRAMSGIATLVTLSNVTPLEADTDQLRRLLHPWVQACFTSCDLQVAKPDPAAFRAVAAAYGTNCGRMVHIGDDWACDVVGARNAGAAAIWISGGRQVPCPRPSDPGVVIVDDLASAAQYLTTIESERPA